jgi:long-subunit fatty acid transport protein
MRLAGLLALSTYLAPAPAFAGGVALPIRGVRALSVAGAHVASAEQANAFWYNPARIGNSSIMVEVGTVHLDSHYAAPDGSTADNIARPWANPTFGAIWRITDWISIGAAAYAPYSPQQRYHPEGPQRYSLVDSDENTQLYLAAGFAVRLNRFSFGATFQNVMTSLKQQTVLSGYTGLFGYAQDPELDIINELELHDRFSPTGNFGAAFDAGPVSFGVAVQLPFTVSGEADFRVRMGQSVFFDPIVVEGNKVHFEVPFPVMVRGGVSWRIIDDLMIEAAVNWEDWSVQQQLVVDPQGQIVLHGVPGIGDYEMGPLLIDRRLRDTLSLHLGGDGRIYDTLHLRGGVFWEPSAFGDETFSLAQFDGNKIGFALGLSYQIWQIRIDAGASYVFQPPRNITTSEQRQINPTNPDQAEVIANGRYSGGYWVGGGGLTWLID